MTDVEIRDILVGHLTNHSTKEALALSQRDVGFSLVEELTDATFSSDFLDILKIAIVAQGDYAFVAELRKEEGVIVFFPAGQHSRLLSLFEGFERVLFFLYQHYDDLSFSGQAGNLSKEALGNIVLSTNEKLQRYRSDLKEKGHIKFDPADLNLVGPGLSLVLYVLLGQEKWQKFAERFNHYTEILRKMQAELIPRNIEA